MEDVSMLRRQLERAEGDVRRARAEQTAANDERARLLRERQGWIREIEQLRATSVAIAQELIALRTEAELRKKPMSRR
jgi:hypothetical protein